MTRSPSRRRLLCLVALIITGIIGSWLPTVPAGASTFATISNTALPFATTNGDILAVLDVNVSGQPIVVFGGDFSSVTTTDGVVHAATNMAAVNETTGALVFAATGLGATGYVRALAYWSGVVYAGGDFTTFGTAARSYLVALNVPGWTVSTWNPGASAHVNTIATDPHGIYVAGAAGTVRSLSATTGKANWSDSVAAGGVRTLLPDTATGGLYVGGFFDTVGGFTNHGLVEVNELTGAPITTFAPVLQPNSGVGAAGSFDGEDPLALALDTNTTPTSLVVGSGGKQNHIRLLDATTGANLWDVFAPGDMQAVLVLGDSIVAGYHRNRINSGDFSWPYYAAQLQASNGTLQPWQAGISTQPATVTDGGNNGVRSFAYDPVTGVLVAGGAFTTYGASCNPNVTLTCTGGQKMNSLAAWQVSGLPPLADSAPTVTSSSATTADVSWAPVSGATSYSVQRSVSGANSFTTVASNLTGTSLHDTGLTPGGSYDYEVVATNAAGSSPPSPLTTVTTVPAQPGPVTATANGTGEIDLSWPAATGATSYDVQRGPGGSGTFTTDLGIVTGTTYSDTGHNPGDSFDYQVIPLDSAGAGTPSSTVTGTTLPAQVSGLAATPVSATEIDLAWSPATGAATYTVQRALHATTSWSTVATGVTGTSYADTSVGEGTSYDYQVAAVDAGGTGAFSTTQTATTPQAAPGKVTGLSATAASTTEIDLSWNPTTGATAYEVDRSSTSATSGFSPLVTGLTSPSFADTTAAPQTTYWYQVVASNAMGPGPASDVASTTTLPAQVTGLTATAASASEIDLAWNPAAGATSYVVQRAPHGSTSWSTLSSGSSATSFADTSVASGTSYDYQVAAVGPGGTGAFSATQAATTPTVAPGQVTGLAATAASTTEVDLSWTAAPRATAYEVDRSSTSASSGFTALVTGLGSPSYADTTAAPQTTYWYRVVASNSAGPGPASAVVEAITLPTNLPLASNSFEGGTSGAAITAANSGGRSGTAFNVVSCSSGTATYTTNANHGSLAAALAPTTSPCVLQWGPTTIPTTTTSYGRMYINLSSSTGLTMVLAKLGTSTFARDAQINLTTAGKLAIYDANNTLRSTFTNVVPSGWVRIEWTLVNSTTAGSVTLSMYSGDANTPIETRTVTGIDTGTGFGGLQLGSVVTTLSAPAPFRIDDVAYGTAGPLGPAH